MGSFNNSKYRLSFYQRSYYRQSPYQFNLIKRSTISPVEGIFIVDNVQLENLSDNVNGDFLVLNTSVSPNYLLDNLDNPILDGNGSFIIIGPL